MSDVEFLRALEAAATPAPWEAVTASGPKRRKQQVAMVGRTDMRGQGEKGCLAVLAGLNTHRADDADLIAAARNALPDLLDRLERAVAERDVQYRCAQDLAAALARVEALRPTAKRPWSNQGRSGYAETIDYAELRAALVTEGDGA